MAIDVRKFGAISTRDDATFDSTDALLDAVGSGEPLYVPDRHRFLVSAQLAPTADEFTMEGTGWLALADGADCGILKVDAGVYAVIDGVRFDGNRANQASGDPLLHVANGAYARLTRLHIKEGKSHGALLENVSGSTLADECNLLNSFIFSNDGDGLRLAYSGSPAQGIGDLIVAHNHINYNGGSGIHQLGGSASVFDTNNVLTNLAYGIHLEGVPGDSFVTRTTLKGNQVRNNAKAGLRAEGGNTLHAGGLLVVAANHFHYNNAVALGMYANAEIWDTDYPTIVGNTFGDLDFTPRAIYGLTLSKTTGASVTANTFHQNVTGGLHDFGSSSYTTRGNVGSQAPADN